MNKELNIEYLYDLFLTGLRERRDPRRFFSALFKNEDFLSMLSNKPYDISSILETIMESRRTKAQFSENQIRYLSFLVVEFIDRVSLPLRKIPQYIDADDVLSNFLPYHSMDIEEVVFRLLIKHNEEYSWRQARKDLVLNEDTLPSSFMKLFPLKRYQGFHPVFDQRLMKTLYLCGNEILFISSNVESLFGDEYFLNRYSVGNRLYCFLDAESLPVGRFPIHLFVVSEDSILYREPSGLEHRFLFSR